MKEVNQAISKLAHELMQQEGRVTVTHAMEVFLVRYDVLWREYAEEMALEDIRTRFKRILRNWEEKVNGQPILPGIFLPMAIPITPPDGEAYWVNTSAAVWQELQVGLDIREANISAAVARRDEYLDAMDRLRPWMENHPTCTVEEALRKMHKGRGNKKGSGNGNGR